MKKESQKQFAAAQKFWDAFKASAEDNRVRPDLSRFYVKWVQAFVNFQPGKRLRHRSRYEKDQAKGVPGVYIWPALARKYPKAASEWIWQYVFPAKSLSVDPRSGTVRRHHINENLVQKAVKKATSRAGISKKVSCHTLRHYAEFRIMPSNILKHAGSLVI